MDLRPVLAAIARDLGLTALTHHKGNDGNIKETYKSASTMVAMARDENHLATFMEAGWIPAEDKGWRVWTDNYSNDLQAIFAAEDVPDAASANTSQ